MSYYDNVDEVVTIFLRRERMTQAELASKVGLSDVQFARKRRGEADWWVAEIIRLCEIVGAKPSDLFIEK